MKHSEKVATSRVQTTAVRVLQQMKRPDTQTVDEHYTEGEPSYTEVFRLPCSILIIK
jgi:hypothetical protein